MRRKVEAAKKLYFLMNKKSGTVCSTVSDRRHTVYEVFSPEQLISPEGAKLHSVGRLDADTEGLLLFTNDGKLSDFLTRPENKINKKYFVKLKNPVQGADKAEYEKKAFAGLVLPPDKKFGEQQSGPAVISWKKDSDTDCFISVVEGKFHEVKRIFSALGNEVVYLKRTEFAGIELNEKKTAPGQFRELSLNEIETLKNLMFL